MKVYFLATIRDIDVEGPRGAIRTVGFFENFDEAKKCILNNTCDLYERGYYKYAVIETAEPGLYPDAEDAIFFKWVGDIETGGYQEIERPVELKAFCNFSIG